MFKKTNELLRKQSQRLDVQSARIQELEQDLLTKELHPLGYTALYFQPINKREVVLQERYGPATLYKYKVTEKSSNLLKIKVNFLIAGVHKTATYHYDKTNNTAILVKEKIHEKEQTPACRKSCKTRKKPNGYC